MPKDEIEYPQSYPGIDDLLRYKWVRGIAYVIMGGMVCSFVLGMVVLFNALYPPTIDMPWDQYIVKHKCRETSRTENAGLTFVPVEITYMCDNGVQVRH